MKLEGNHQIHLADFWIWVSERYKVDVTNAGDIEFTLNEDSEPHTIKITNQDGSPLVEISFERFWAYVDHHSEIFGGRTNDHAKLSYGVPRFDREAGVIDITVSVNTEPSPESPPQAAREWEDFRLRKLGQEVDSNYFRTLVTYEVLSRGAPFTGSAEDLAEQIVDGDCSGIQKTIITQRVSPKEMVRLLEAQGSDGDFLVSEEDLDDEAPELETRRVARP